MTVEDLEIGQVYEVVEEFDSGYTVYAHPELKSVFARDTHLRVGTLMKYAEYGEYPDRSPDTSLVYGFHIFIDGEIAENKFDLGGLFWFSEEELS